MPLELPSFAEAGQPLAGVVLLGGAHGSLAMARSFGRLGIPVALVSDDHPLPKWSRHLQSHSTWPGADRADAAEWLANFAADRGHLNWLLLPCGDAEVKLVASERQTLSRAFRLLSCGWDRLKTVCDKQRLAASAAAAGIPCPNNYRIRSETDLDAVTPVFPVVLKPALRTAQNPFTQAKAWRADDRAALVARYREAAAMVGSDNIVVQELIPGGGATQFSYVALWCGGKPVLEMTARRTRQYPLDFSYTSTFVEVWPNESVRAASVRLLSAIAFEGLVEVEYKLDTREGTCKILDVNPRPWSWIALCEASGLNFAAAIRDIAADLPLEPAVLRTDYTWIHATRDFAAALQLIARGDLSLTSYLASLAKPRVFSTFASDDPMPALVDLPITAYRVITRRLLRRSRGRKARRQGGLNQADCAKPM
jgi:predicted ATP-grasp superfamily ATP-dependent carboligase